MHSWHLTSLQHPPHLCIQVRPQRAIEMDAAEEVVIARAFMRASISGALTRWGEAGFTSTAEAGFTAGGEQQQGSPTLGAGALEPSRTHHGSGS